MAARALWLLGPSGVKSCSHSASRRTPPSRAPDMKVSLLPPRPHLTQLIGDGRPAGPHAAGAPSSHRAPAVPSHAADTSLTAMAAPRASLVVFLGALLAGAPGGQVRACSPAARSRRALLQPPQPAPHRRSPPARPHDHRSERTQRECVPVYQLRAGGAPPRNPPRAARAHAARCVAKGTPSETSEARSACRSRVCSGSVPILPRANSTCLLHVCPFAAVLVLHVAARFGAQEIWR